jgi:hypothetical protein
MKIVRRQIVHLPLLISVALGCRERHRRLTKSRALARDISPEIGRQIGVTRDVSLAIWKLPQPQTPHSAVLDVVRSGGAGPDDIRRYRSRVCSSFQRAHGAPNTSIGTRSERPYDVIVSDYALEGG